MVNNKNLDSSKQYLIQEGSGAVFVWSEAMSKREDMRPYDVAAGRAVNKYATVVDVKKVSLEIQGKTFQVESELKEIVDSLLVKLVELKEDVARVKAENEENKQSSNKSMTKKGR